MEHNESTENVFQDRSLSGFDQPDVFQLPRLKIWMSVPAERFESLLKYLASNLW